MPGVNVRRDGMGSPEPTADREHTQVANLCYVGDLRGAARANRAA
jgi:hypothetical protein